MKNGVVDFPGSHSAVRIVGRSVVEREDSVKAAFLRIPLSPPPPSAQEQSPVCNGKLDLFCK